MRKFSVKVNGHVYDVEVTECTNGNSMGTVGMVSAPVTTSAPTAPVVPRTAPTVSAPIHPQPTTYSSAPARSSAALERLMNKAEHKEDKQPVVAEGGLQVKAPMPGKITFITAKVREPVNKGDELMVLEAMKMGNTITAPVSGVVKAINVNVGQVVQGKQTLCTIE